MISAQGLPHYPDFVCAISDVQGERSVLAVCMTSLTAHHNALEQNAQPVTF